MENNKVFTYQYSAKQNLEVERIRKSYLQEENKLETLRHLDRRAQTAGTAESLSLGVVGILIFGIGMCFGLDVFTGADWLSVFFCTVGILVMLPAYFVHRSISEKTKKALTPEILRISEELLSSGNVRNN